MKVYIAGPMTGHPQFNFPRFDEAAAWLREMGFEVVSPAEMDDPETRKAALASPDGAPGSGTTNGETWGDFLARDVKLVADEVDAIAAFDDWWTSRGARLEVYCAHLTGKPVYSLNALQTVGADTTPLEAQAIEAGVHGRDPYATADALAKSVYGEQRITNEQTGGQKGRKPQRLELIPYDSLMRIAEVYAFGAQKYDDNNWRKGYAWSLSFGALMRHLALWWEGDDTDDETGLSHIAHAGFHVLALLHFEQDERYAELDDRPEV